ncbi:MAG: glycosyltransferase [Rhodobacteraceae bacterium]|nr:glycosyltransferase [Paracoccaceae bacterium]
MSSTFDAIVIGRNEGARLHDAIVALTGQARRIVYVDSGSDDDSIAIAAGLGAETLALDPARPFTAARARNEGLAHLGDDAAEFIQFVDGDCVLERGWPQAALAFLHDHPKAALVHGHNFEEAPEASVYNWLTDWEWRKPVGPETSGLGMFMARAGAIGQMGGMRDGMIAAEDDELFLRLRKAGWETWCIDTPMGQHDVALHRFAPWFRRAIRAGHSFAELGALHRGAARAARLRALLWAGILPALALLTLAMWPWALLGVAALYAGSMLRQWHRFTRIGLTPARAAQAALLIMISKFANLHGMMTYWLRRLRRSDARIIEYKPRATGQ